jgi:holin-like protein
MINTFAVLLVFQTMGEGLAYALSLPVPGPVIGMLLLFLYLILNSEAVHRLAPTSLELLKHLSLLFVPAGVGIMVHAQRIAAELLPITVALVASTVVSIAVTAAVVRWLQKPADPEDDASGATLAPVPATNPSHSGITVASNTGSPRAMDGLSGDDQPGRTP